MSTFGAVVGARSEEGREEFRKYHSSAIQIPSEAISTIETISKEVDVFLVVGVIEKDGGTLYCTAVFIDPQVGYVGKHRKLVPTASERLIWGMGDGTTLPVVEATFKGHETTRTSSVKEPTVLKNSSFRVKVSATICW